MNVSRNKLLFMSITVLLMILLSQLFAYTGETFSVENKTGKTTDRVNFRKAANAEQVSIIKTLTPNTNVQIIGDIKDYYISLLQNNEVGLIAKNYVNVNPEVNQTKTDYISLDKFYTIITGDKVNVRGGPGTQFTVYTGLNKDTKVEVIGKINDWYLIVTANNTVGFIKGDFLESKEKNSNSSDSDSSTLPNTAETVLSLINAARKNAGLTELKVDPLLNSVATTKAVDMVENNYFSHESAQYGSPFKMMQQAGITYKTAGENIAANKSVQLGVESWLNSESHKQNILSSAYNYVGIGVEKSDIYGYIIVAMFIGK